MPGVSRVAGPIEREWRAIRKTDGVIRQCSGWLATVDSRRIAPCQERCVFMKTTGNRVLTVMMSACIAAGLSACSSSGDDSPADPPNPITANEDTPTVPANDAAGVPPGAPGDGAGTADADASGTPTTGVGSTGMEPPDAPPSDVVDAGIDEDVVPPTAGGGADPVSGEVLRLGTIVIDQGDAGDPESGSFSAGFVGIASPLPAGTAVEALGPAIDTCSVSEIDAGDFGGFGDRMDLPGMLGDIEFLDAGETITLSSPAGTWLTVLKRETFGFPFYGIDEDVPFPAPVPDGLTVDIPGADFPAFANVSVVDVAPLTGVVTAGTDVTADTVYRWDAGADPRTRIEISASSSTFLTLGSGGSIVSLDCLVADDGEFSLSAATRAELGTDFSGDAALTRLGITVVQDGDAILMVSNSGPSN